MHSSAYKNGASYREKRVLVVGFGNSGGEIAVDLFEHGAMPTLSVRSPVNVIPRDVLGLPILATAIPLEKLPTRLADVLSAPVVRPAFGNLDRVGLHKAVAGPFDEIKRRGLACTCCSGRADPRYLSSRGDARAVPNYE